MMSCTGNVDDSFETANYCSGRRVDGNAPVESAVVEGGGLQHQRGIAPAGHTAVSPRPELADRLVAGGHPLSVVQPVDIGRRRAKPGETVQTHRVVDHH